MTRRNARSEDPGSDRLVPALRMVLWALVAVLLGVRALAPTGYMPAVSDDGIRLVVCSGTSTIDWKLPQPESPRDDPSSDVSCPFVLAPFQAATPEPTPLPAPASEVVPETRPTGPPKTAKPRPFSPATPATGPPQFA